MLSRRQVYLLAVIVAISLLYIFKLTIPLPQNFKVVPLSENSLEDPSSAYSITTTHPAKPDPIVLTFVLMGQPAALEGLVSIKSAIMHASRPLDIHLICSEDSVEIIEPAITLIRQPYYSLNVIFHVVPLKRVEERLTRAGIGIGKRNWPMLSKLLMHEILIDVEKTIFVDTDMIFVVDPAQLWDNFRTFDDNALLALPTLGPTSHAGEICTCVMLLNLERMRRPEPNSLLIPSSLIPQYKDILTEALDAAERDGIPNMKGRPERASFSRKDAPFGDQGIIYALWMHRPALFPQLSLRWDITQCRSSYGLRLGGFLDKDGKPVEDDTAITEQEQLQIHNYNQKAGEGLIVPGILHFNCQPDAGTNVWEWIENHDDTLKTWAPMVTTTVRYKWIWLNRGNGSANTSIVKHTTIRWLDERIHDSDSEENIIKMTGRRAS
ncbi:hypothetical protein CVT24_003640 [Panaeolus cyanescens]|uniref:Glycosyltransferase family 8 protein n=1 Tax=Panaeolus cyanescens TaxID=181874 RepID=A0A409Y7T6_9AGAR|nr:hypothetical protein CVT24_003640 [Panaeolus cyanescens]